MPENDSPSLYPSLLEVIDAAYERHTGKGLGMDCCPVEIEHAGRSARLAWIDRSAPFGVLAHNTESDPKFVYVNDEAVRMFGYGRDEFIGLPSRLSASPDRREARAAFLEVVRALGIADQYADIRVDRLGRPFRIRDGVVWQLNDASGAVVGQAALIWFGGNVE